MKKQKIIFWICTLIIVLWEGVMPLATLIFAPQYATVGTRPLGYPDYFSYSLMFAKMLGVIAIALPQTPGRLREWAYAGLSFNLIFAALSHLVVDQNPGYVIMPLIFFGILMVSYVYHHKLRSNR